MNELVEAKYQRMHTDYYRECGMIMDMLNFIEIQMSKFLSNVLCKQEYKEVFERFVMYDSLTFDKKKLLFTNLKSKGLLKEYEPYKKIGGDLEYIQKLRNKMAHAVLLTDQSAVNSYDGSKFMLISFSGVNGPEKIEYNISQAAENPDKHIFAKDGVIERAERLKDWFDKSLSKSNMI